MIFMKMWNEYEETRELLHELENNEVEFEARENGKVYVNVTNDYDELEGIWSIKYEPYWDAWKMIWFFLEDNEIKSAKTIAFSIEQILENILA